MTWTVHIYNVQCNIYTYTDTCTCTLYMEVKALDYDVHVIAFACVFPFSLEI